MASTWNRWLPAALVFASCVVLPRLSAAQQTGTGQSQSGQTGQTGGFGQANQVGSLSEMNLGGQVNTEFLRENRTPGQQLAGLSTEGVGNTRGMMGQNTQGTSGMFGNQGGMNSMMGGFNSMNPMGSLYTAGLVNSLSRQRQQLRVPLRLGPDSFPFSSAAAPPIATGPNLRVQTRLARIPQLKERGSVKVEMEGQVAILRGEVQSQHERDLVGRVVLLEPGVADVRNELQVAAAKPSPAP